MSQLRPETCRNGDHHSTCELTKPTVSKRTSVKASLSVLFVGWLSLGVSAGGDTGSVFHVSGVVHEFTQVCMKTRREPPVSSLKSHLPC